MSKIKQRRLALPVDCHAATNVGDYVPFYFCPRSIMLFVIHCRNNPALTYRGGQGPIVHLVLDLHEVVAWTTSAARRWAFSLSNAGARYANFRAELGALAELSWDAIAATDFRSEAVKEAKQAEFLVHESIPWSLVRAVGVHSPTIKTQVENALVTASHRPPVAVQSKWYY